LEVKDPKLLVFGVLTVLTQLSLILPFTLMQARVESIAYVSISIAMSAIRIGLAIVFVAYLGWGLSGVYWSMLITFVGFGLVLMARELRRGSLSVDWRKCLAMTRFSLPFVPTGVLFFLLYNGDRFFLLGTAGTAAVGIYSLGAKLAGGVAIVSTTPLFKVWSARMYVALERPGGSRYGGRMLSQMLLAYSFVGLGLCLFHREMLAILSHGNYAGAGSVIAPLVLANGFLFAATFMECAFYVRHRTILKPFTAVVGTAVTIALYAILIPRYSILGAAYATLLGYAAMALVTYFVAQRVLQIQYEIGAIIKLIAISVLCYLPATYLELGLWQMSAKFGLFVVWILAVWLSGILRLEDFVKRFETATLSAEAFPNEVA
jgi:O-antigen/teichoic acid export membrane protein